MSDVRTITTLQCAPLPTQEDTPEWALLLVPACIDVRLGEGAVSRDGVAGWVAAGMDEDGQPHLTFLPSPLHVEAREPLPLFPVEKTPPTRLTVVSRLLTTDWSLEDRNRDAVSGRVHVPTVGYQALREVLSAIPVPRVFTTDVSLKAAASLTALRETLALHEKVARDGDSDRASHLANAMTLFSGLL